MIIQYDNSSQSFNITKLGESDESYDDFVASLPVNEGCYGISKVNYEVNGAKRSKIIGVLWCHSGAPTKTKMIYAASVKTLKNALVGIQVSVHGSDVSEVEKECILEKCQRFR